MSTLPQKERNVKRPSDRFMRNCLVAIKAGYILRCTTTQVYVRGIPVSRDLFELSHPLALLAFLDDRIGRKGLFFPLEV